jgi:O-Antigen ligase
MLGAKMNGVSGSGLPREGRVDLPWTGLRLDADRLEGVAVAASVLVSLLVAAALQVSPAAALGMVALLAAGTFVARLGAMGVALLLAGAIPWLVVFSAVEPKLTETFTAGTMVVVLLMVAAPRHDGTRASARLRLGMILFYVPVLIGLAREPGGAQFIEAAKYIVFPFTVLAVTEGTNRPALKRLSKVAFVSAVIAVAFNLVAGAAGLGHSYYAAGDIEGLSGEHDLALLTAALTAAGLGMGTSLRSVSVSALGTVATIATGVRSALPGLVLVVLAKMVGAQARMRTAVAVAVVAGAVVVSGAGNVVVQRFKDDQALGQYSSFAAFGSGRGEIYTTAIHGWWVSSPLDWAFGTGLRSVEVIEQHATGNDVVAQSDVVQVGVESGLIALVGLVLIWWTLIVRAESKLPLFVLLPFALFNGSLEYGAPLVVTLLFTVSPAGAVEDLGARRGAGSPPGSAADGSPAATVDDVHS